MADQQRPTPGIGCLGTIVGVLVLVGVVVLVVFVGVFALLVVAGLVVVGLVVWAVDRLLLALSPKRRERREAAQRAFVWRFGGIPTGTDPFGGPGAGDVIDTTATEDGWSDGGDPGQLGRG